MPTGHRRTQAETTSKRFGERTSVLTIMHAQFNGFQPGMRPCRLAPLVA
jgi:hypothetical protein